MAEQQYVKSIAIFYCGSEKCQSGHFFGPAVRTQYLLHFIVSGKGVYELHGKRYPLKAGEGFLIRPGELTYYRADDAEPWSYMWMAFDGYEAAELLKLCGFGYVMRAVHPTKFGASMNELIRIFGTPEYNEYKCLALFYEMMSQLVLPSIQPVGSYSREYFDKAAFYIRNNFSYPITIADVAKYVGIDRTYLYKIFVAHGGFSPKQFLLDVRVGAAKNMMSAQGYSLAEVALSCGFKDASAFCNHFKHKTGKTPKEFRTEIAENRHFHSDVIQ